MGRPILSIIIPAYNVAGTIERCLDSVFAQIPPEESDAIEVLVVNDCSPDNVADILKAYQRREPRLRVKNRETNGKEAGAHNTGVRETTGEYFLRLDADDALRAGAIADFKKIILNHRPDIILHGFDTVDPNGKVLGKKTYPATGFFKIGSDKASDQRIVFYEAAFGIMTPNVVYRREASLGVEQDVSFPVSGDRYYGWCVFKQSQSVYITNESWVNYYQYPQSLSHHISDKGLEGLLELDRRFWTEFAAKKEFEVGQEYAFERLIRGLLGWRYSLVFADSTKGRPFRRCYVDTLKCYVDAPIARRVLGCAYPILWCAVKFKSLVMVSLYKRFYEPYIGRLISKIKRMMQTRRMVAK